MSICKRLGHNSMVMVVKPVALPPGYRKLATTPLPSGSMPTPKTIGLVQVASMSIFADGSPMGKIKASRVATMSAARAGAACY